MRTYKFRAKDNNGNWRYGHLLTRDIDTWRVYIREMSVENEPPRYTDYEVDPESVGQCTNKWDKKGVDIYEKDILERDGVKAAVVWDKSRLIFTVNPLLAQSLRPDAQVLIMPSCEVVGNTVDNISLLIL